MRYCEASCVALILGPLEQAANVAKIAKAAIKRTTRQSGEERTSDRIDDDGRFDMRAVAFRQWRMNSVKSLTSCDATGNGSKSLAGFHVQNKARPHLTIVR